MTFFALIAAPGAQEASATGGGGPAPVTECVGELERLTAERAIAEFRQRTGQVFLPDSSRPGAFSFYPAAGTLYGDLFTDNFVDLDPTTGILDWDCSDYTYDGHDASDVGLRTFGEQAIGVPVFAALDGLVVATHDGEPDTNTSCTGTGNSVIVDHGHGRVCWYWHLRKASVQVVPGQLVKAGEQLGLVGSSGCSTGPHLHFATFDNGNLVEPYAGPCRPGPSAWAAQTPIERDLYVRDLNLTAVNIANQPGLPWDMPRTGTFLQGPGFVRFWAMLCNVPAATSWRVRILRPDDSEALNVANVFQTPFQHRWWRWWSFFLDLDQLGTWEIELFLNDSEHARVPFDVVALSEEIVNRPPYPIGASLEPARPGQDDVLLCRVGTDLVLDDPDYDIVRYRYVWSVDGVVARDVTTAAQADAFPRRTAPPGSFVTCAVTPSDGIDSGPTVIDTVRISSGRGLYRALGPGF